MKNKKIIAIITGASALLAIIAGVVTLLCIKNTKKIAD